MSQTTVKIGPKQKHLQVPDGWVVVTEGVCKIGDMCANISNPNKPEWMRCTEDEEVGDAFDTFEVLIRDPKYTSWVVSGGW